MTVGIYRKPVLHAAGQYRLGRLLIMCGLLTFMGLVLSVNRYITGLLTNQSVPWLTALITQLLPQIIWCAFIPIVIWIDERLRLAGKRWPARLLIHFLASIIISMVQTAIFGLVYLPLSGLPEISLSTLTQLYQSMALTRMVMGIVVYKLILTTKYALDYYEQYRAEKNHSALLEAQLAQAELQALKMQLQPHFLFNALNSISSLALEDARAAVHMIARLGDFLRLTIENNGTQIVSLEQELEFLRCYLDIEQVRFRDRLRVDIDVDSSTLRAQVPNLILQPIIENAIKHGVATRQAAGRICVRAHRNDGQLNIEVRDDGPGLPGNGNRILYVSEGIGLANTRERLRQLYRNDFTLELSNVAEGGTLVALKIPFVNEVVEGELSQQKLESDAMGHNVQAHSGIIPRQLSQPGD